MSTPFEVVERDRAVLERIARGYDATSPEGRALRRAALALMFTALDARDEFEEFLRHADADAADEAKAYLAELRAKRK